MGEDRNADGPARVLTGDGGNDYFTLDFPWELNNTDYLRRVLAQLTFALRPSYEKAIRAGGKPPVRNNRGDELQAADVDCYYVLKHIREHTPYYSKELGQGQDFLSEAVNWLNGARNKLAHESLDGVNREYLADAFSHAKQLASAARVPFVQENVRRLQTQFKVHQKSKQDRKSAQGQLNAETSLPSAAASSAVRRDAATGVLSESPELAALRQKLNEYKEKGDLENGKLLKLCVDARAKYEGDCARLTSSINASDAGYRKALARDDFDGAKRIREQLPELQARLQNLSNDPKYYVIRYLRDLQYPLKGPEGLRSLYSEGELKQAGYTALALMQAGCTLGQLKQAGYTAQELKQASYTAQELKQEGYTAPELQHAGYTAKELRQAGYTALQLKQAGYTALALMQAGYTAQELQQVGYTLQELKQAGYTAQELRQAGYT